MTLDTLPSVQENGHAPDPYTAAAEAQRQALDHEIDALQQLLAAEQDVGRRLTELVQASRARERRLAKAITALEGEPMTAATPAPAKPRKSKGDKYNWNVSEKMIGRVFAAMRELDAPSTHPDIADKTGASREATRRALDTLRQRELVRLAGETRVGNNQRAVLYALMPEAARAA